MQSHYVSLDPSLQDEQGNIFARRIQEDLLSEARGGDMAKSVGYVRLLKDNI